ncbi:MAG: glycosyltransferase family 4 protein [Nitrospinota bacterium]
MNFFYTTPLFKSYLRKAQELVQDWVKSGTRFLIYGAGEHTLVLSRHLGLTSPVFLGFIDQSEAKQKSGFLGKPVYSLEKGVEIMPDAILISSYEYQGEIAKSITGLAPELVVTALYEKMEAEKKADLDPRPVQIKKEGGEKRGPRIAVIDTFFSWPPIGGSSVDLASVMNLLTLQGCDITFFLPYIEDKLYFPRGRIFSSSSLQFNVSNLVFSQKEFSENIFVERVGTAVDAYRPDYVFLGDMYAFKPSLLLRLKRYKTIWRSYNYDIVCPRMTLLNGSGEPCALSFLDTPEKCRQCVEKDDSLDHAHPIMKELKLARGFSKEYHQKCVRAFDEAFAFIVYNDALRSRLAPRIKNPEKIKIIPTGIFPDDFSGNPKENRSKKVTIFLPGRVQDPVKGFSFYLQVFQKLKKKYNNIELLITGKFDPVIEGVRSVGWYPVEKVPLLYKKADFCVIPSLWEEPFGIVALEAMASGVPVLASAAGGLKGIVKDRQTGFLAPPGDFNAFFNFSEALIQSRPLRNRLGCQGEVEAKAYAWDSVVQRYAREVFSV